MINEKHNVKDFEMIVWNLESFFIEVGDMTKMLCHDASNFISQFYLIFLL